MRSDPQLIPVLILPLSIGISILIMYWKNEKARFIGFFNLLFVASYAIYFIQESSWPYIDTFSIYTHQYLSLSITSAIPAVLILFIFFFIYRWVFRYRWAQVFFLIVLLFWAFIILADGNFIWGLLRWNSLTIISLFPSIIAAVSLFFVIKNFNSNGK